MRQVWIQPNVGPMTSGEPICPKCGEELEYPDDVDMLRVVEVFCCSCLSTVEITEVVMYETRVVEGME